MRKTMSVLLLGLIFSGVASTASAVEIRGMPSCGEWVSDRAKGGLDFTASQFWLLGYMSGLVFATSTDALKGTDSSSIYLWMDNYCRANPLKKVNDGVQDLFFELKKQKGL